jgi:hypothetical protein
MSNKDLRIKSSRNVNKAGHKDKDQRVTELTFLKKANEMYPLVSSLNLIGQNEQGGKRGRTTSETDNDPHYVGINTRKRSRSTQRKTRT